MTEKNIAHSDFINSVAFSPDGKTIVSGSRDQTLKVWELRPFLDSEWEEVDISAMPKDSDGEVQIDGLGYISSNYWRNVVTDGKEKNKPSGGMHVVGTLKVWDSGAFWACNHFPACTDRPLRAAQPHWSSRARRRTPTAIGFAPWPILQTERPSFRVLTTRPSKSGIRVRFGPQIAFFGQN